MLKLQEKTLNQLATAGD